MMNARDWVTLVMRLAGVVLLVLALPGGLSAIAAKVSLLIRGGAGTSPFGAPTHWSDSMLFSLSTWTKDIGVVSQIALGCYFLFAGKWLIKVLFRGLGGKEGYCPHCDYDIRGIASSRCPECGKKIRNGPA